MKNKKYHDFFLILKNMAMQKLVSKIFYYNTLNNIRKHSHTLIEYNSHAFLSKRSFNNAKFGVCDPYEQNKIPLDKEECNKYLKSLNNWEILEFKKLDSEPPYTPKFHTSSNPPNSNGCTSNGCNKQACCQNTNVNDVDSAAKPSSKNVRKFLGGNVLRREFRFRTIEMGQEFIEFINNVSINQNHQPYRCIADISRGYGHVMIELYTPFLSIVLIFIYYFCRGVEL